jgi:ABC-type nitrate/sulfonate/bicarbonate transport system substrate-binding protein
MRIINFYFKISLIFIVILSSSCNKKMLPNSLTIGSYMGEGDSLIFIAENKGYFKKNGVNVSIKKYDAGIYAIEDLLKDKIDIATPSEVAFVAKSFDNPDLRIFAVTTFSDIQKILVRSDANIKNPADLIGKRIGTTKGSSAEFALYSYLVLNNININDVKVINLNPNEHLKAIKNKEVDAVISWEPNIYNIRKELGDKVVDLSQNKVPSLYTVLISKSEIIQNKQKEIIAFLNALKNAEDYYTKNNDDSQILIKKSINSSDDYINYSLKNIYFSISLPHDLIFAMENEAKWRINNNMTKNKSLPNYVKYIHFDALETVKPDSITIIK